MAHDIDDEDGSKKGEVRFEDGRPEWDPDPAELREGESEDDDAHARRNAEQLRMAEEELEDEGDG